MTHDEKIAVIQAHIVGRPVQFKIKAYPFSGLCGWRDLTVPDHPFNFAEAEYRIKPEPPKPREWILFEMREGPTCVYPYPFAKALPNAIHVREVLPDEEGKA